MDKGTTVWVASICDNGQTFHDSRTPAEILHARMRQLELTIALLNVSKVGHGKGLFSSCCMSRSRKRAWVRAHDHKRVRCNAHGRVWLHEQEAQRVGRDMC